MAITKGTPSTGESMHVDMGNVLAANTRSEFMPHPTNERFVMACHPLVWDLVDGQLLPGLRHLVVAPGANGTDSHGNASLMVAHAMEDGWAILNQDNPHVGVYAHGTRVRGGTHWHSIWEKLRAIGQNKLDSIVDMDALNTWRRGLVSNGVIAPPSEDAIALKESRIRKRINRTMSRVDAYGQAQQATSVEMLEDLQSADVAGSAPSTERKGLLTGNANTDRATCKASDDIKALKAALKTTAHSTVERVIEARLAKLEA